VNRDALIRDLRAYGRAHGLEVRWEPRQGKGSHGRLTVGARFTMVPAGQIKRFMLETILRQLGLPKDLIR